MHGWMRRRTLAESQEEVQVELSQQFIDDLDTAEESALEADQLAIALDSCAQFRLNAEAAGTEEPVSFTDLLLSDFDLGSTAWQPGHEYRPTPKVLRGLSVPRPVVTSGAT